MKDLPCIYNRYLSYLEIIQGLERTYFIIGLYDHSSFSEVIDDSYIDIYQYINLKIKSEWLRTLRLKLVRTETKIMAFLHIK